MTAKTYLQRHPHARGTSIAQKAIEQEMTARLRTENAMKEIHEEQLRRTPKPWWERKWPSWVWRW